MSSPESHNVENDTAQLSNGGENEPIVRLTYLEEKNRVVTIAYQVYNDAFYGTRIKFAASIFRKQTDKDAFVRKQHAHTARERLILRPLWTEFDMEKHLRKEIHRRGVKAKTRVHPDNKVNNRRGATDSENSSVDLPEPGREEPSVMRASARQNSGTGSAAVSGTAGNSSNSGNSTEPRREHEIRTQARFPPPKASGGSGTTLGGLPGYYERQPIAV